MWWDPKVNQVTSTKSFPLWLVMFGNLENLSNDVTVAEKFSGYFIVSACSFITFFFEEMSTKRIRQFSFV